jgi:dienelactone hydrolase
MSTFSRLAIQPQITHRSFRSVILQAAALVLGAHSHLSGQSIRSDVSPNGDAELLVSQKQASAASPGYRIESVEIILRSNLPFQGTLTLPESSKQFPAILLIPGYVPGYRNRSEEEWRAKGEADTGTALARHLASVGIAVLQVPIGGGAAGNEPSISAGDLADRAVDCMRYLQGRQDIDAKRVGIIGQSIGGFVATLAAARSNDFALAVTLATPMESIDRTFDETLDRVLRDGGAPEAERTAIRGRLEKIVTAASKGAPPDELRDDLREFLRSEYPWLPKPQRQLIGKDAEEFVNKLAEDHLRDFTSPMFRSLIRQDMTQTLAAVHCPMLILFAEKDFKVEPVRSSSIAEAALQNASRENSTVRVVPGVNHFFEGPNRTSSVAQMSNSRFPRAFLDSITPWLLKNLAAR